MNKKIYKNNVKIIYKENTAVNNKCRITIQTVIFLYLLARVFKPVDMCVTNHK